MKKDKNYWEPVFDEFVDRYPDLAEDIIDWYPSAQLEITVRLKDGRKYAYDWMVKSLWLIYDPEDDVEELSEMEWRSMFSKNLLRKMRNVGMTQDELSYITGISQVTISKYINCKTTPGTYNVRKIANALKCSIGELIYE